VEEYVKVSLRVVVWLQLWETVRMEGEGLSVWEPEDEADPLGVGTRDWEDDGERVPGDSDSDPGSVGDAVDVVSTEKVCVALEEAVTQLSGIFATKSFWQGRSQREEPSKMPPKKVAEAGNPAVLATKPAGQLENALIPPVKGFNWTSVEPLLGTNQIDVPSNTPPAKEAELLTKPFGHRLYPDIKPVSISIRMTRSAFCGTNQMEFRATTPPTNAPPTMENPVGQLL
jgi:hypothetical protein